MTTWIEGKNPSLYDGGISAWLFDMLENCDIDELADSVLVVPAVLEKSIFPSLGLHEIKLPWVSEIPNKINHVIYDWLTFRIASIRYKPDLVFSPYYDVRISRKTPYVITIHDLCFLEVPEVYSRLQIFYFVRAMQRNIKRSIAIVTVSQTSKSAILSRFKVSSKKILVVPNQLNKDFDEFNPSPDEIHLFRRRLGDSEFNILYTGGLENRKNIPNLLKGLNLLLQDYPDFQFCVTGQVTEKWEELLDQNSEIANKTVFLGHLTNQELKCAYISASVVVYPSLSEGFGRACIEAMSTGTPLVCSDIPIFREISGDYAEYFQPRDPNEIAKALKNALGNGRKDRQAVRSPISTHEDLTQLRSILFSRGL
jgi:glycosyltransferase involved in cell wall biosynthesis